MPDRPTCVYLLVEEDENPPWREYVIGVYVNRSRAHDERKARQAEEDENGVYQRYRYSVQQHWVSDAWETAGMTKEGERDA